MTSTLQVQLAHPDARVPKRMSNGAAGYDLCSVEDVVIAPRGIGKVNTGICIRVPEGTYGRVGPRSGLAIKGIDVGAGIIDRDYTGLVQVILYNHSDNEFKMVKGDRVAQLVIEAIQTPMVMVVSSLDATERGASGFGSTGIQ